MEYIVIMTLIYCQLPATKVASLRAEILWVKNQFLLKKQQLMLPKKHLEDLKE